MSAYRLVSAAVLAAILSAGPVSAGQVSLRIEPRGEAAEAVSTGFRLYSLFRSHKKNTASVDQRGSGNGAAIAQHGDGNWADVVQRGSGHSGQITQTGRNNVFGLFQFGRKTETVVSQSGNGKVGFEFLGGW